MATLREIRSRISSVKSTQKITKAMKMVAAAKLRRAQDAVISARPYARKMKELLQHLVSVVDVSSYPLFTAREVKNVVIIVVTSDRGLCGAFNSNVIRSVASHIRTNYGELQKNGNVKLVCVGKKGFEFFTKNGYPVMNKDLGITATLNFSRTHGEDIVARMTKGFLGGEYDRVEVVYNEFKSIIQQHILIDQLLPVPSTDAAQTTAHEPKSRVDYIYEPSSAEIIAALVPKHLNFQLLRVLLESNAAEQGARMTAMENATTNASDLIKDLQLSYNNARQASITKELLEIVSGAEALAQAG